MKKFALVAVIVCLAIGTVAAQGWGNPWANNQSITIAGTLQLQNGTIAVVSGNNTYFVPMLTQYIGFIEGLKEGSQVSIDGFASGNFVQPSKVTINGKAYDFPSNGSRGMAYGGRGNGNRGGGYCDGGGYGGCWGQSRGCW